MARNTVLLVRSGLLSTRWRLGYAFWITKYAGFHVLAVRPRLQRLRFLARGALDGLRGRTGPLERARPQ
jgi:rhamnosyltransferase